VNDQRQMAVLGVHIVDTAAVDARQPQRGIEDRSHGRFGVGGDPLQRQQQVAMGGDVPVYPEDAESRRPSGISRLEQPNATARWAGTVATSRTRS
jgi:hypothetical protein